MRVTTAGALLVGPRDAARRTLVQDGVPTALAAHDATLWGEAAAAEARIRLGWLDLPNSSYDLLPRLAALRDELRAEGLDHVALCGMGGSSLAPEVICGSAGVELTVVDSTDPHQVARAVGDRLERTVVVVSSKSGGTIETQAQQAIYFAAFRAAGLSDAEAHRRFVVVTDPGSPLAAAGERDKVRALFLADPNVGGRYSALSAFGLVPAALAGADVGQLLDDGQATLPDLAREVGNPGLDLGAALGGLGGAGRDKVVLVGAGSGLVDFGDWAEQLVAESTGKDGRGLLPVVVSADDAPGAKVTATNDVHLVQVGAHPATGTGVTGPLGAQFLVWEYAVALAGRVLGINPFDQPNVAESKANTAEILASAGGGALPTTEPTFRDDAVEVFDPRGLLPPGTITVGAALDALVDAVPARGYLSIHAYLDRFADASCAQLRDLLAARTTAAVTFGWGPRFLHSTGQYHKGGPQVGAFLQITGAVTRDVEVPGQPFTLGRLQAAQALGDLRALAGRGRPVLRVHLRDRAGGLRQLFAACGGQ
ncbi:MAG: glucose-6-phosphate isomerase [Mycobacteriales bacterium]